LRVFCDVPGGGLEQVRSGGSCPVGARLAFAAGALAPLSHVALSVRGAGLGEAESFAVEGRPGHEAALDFTPLLERPGPVVIVAGFGDSAEAARAALEGSSPERAVLVRHAVQVERRP